MEDQCSQHFKQILDYCFLFFFIFTFNYNLMNPKKETREAVSDAVTATDTNKRNKAVILIFGTFSIRFVLEEKN